MTTPADQSVPSARRGSYAKTAARRQEILEASIEVFGSHGYRSGSIRDIADRVGMSQAGLLHHFASKGELLAAVLELRDSQSIDLAGNPDGVDFLRGVLRVIDDNLEHRGLMELHCLLAAEATAIDHPAHRHFVDRYHWVVDNLAKTLEASARQGVLREGVDPANAARDVIALWDGLQLQWLLDADSVDIAAQMRRYMQSLVTVEL